MNTKEYRTRTFFREAPVASVPENIWPIGLDIGYSGVKVVSCNQFVCFPSYALENESTTILSIGEQDAKETIQYIDENGTKWVVGAFAQNSISPTDTTAGSMAIFGRNRYYSPMFTVLARVGLASGMMDNEFGAIGDRELHVETGLPPKFLKADKPFLIDVLSGHHEFSVKFGTLPWKHYDFDLKPENISVIAQPMGTLFSVSTDKNMNLLPEAYNYFSKRVLIGDPGFNTFDLFPVIMATVNENNSQTFDNLGMKQVLKQTADDIFKEFSFEVSVPAMQRYLETGEVVKREGKSYKKASFGHILEKNSKNVCEKAIEKIIEIYNPMIDYDYIILTGGTGAAWSNYFRYSEYFRDCDTFKIISGNQGDTSLPYYLSNARGYFIHLYTRITK